MIIEHKQFEPLTDILDLLPGFLYQLQMDPSGKFTYLYISEGVEHILGLSAAKVMEDADSIMSLIHPEDIGRVIEESLVKAEKLEPWYGEFRMHSVDGREMYFEAQDSPRIMPDGAIVWTGYANNVTEKRELQRKISMIARQDSLTGTPNRKSFYETLENMLHLAARKNKSFALMFVDLDRFKPVNDHHGHSTGDIILQDVTRRISSVLRAYDTCCRYGGDEFLVLLPDVENGESAGAVARKIIEAIRRPFFLDSVRISISASIGIVLYPHHGTSADALINNADRAMYEAKSNGSGRFSVFQQLGITNKPATGK